MKNKIFLPLILIFFIILSSSQNSPLYQYAFLKITEVCPNNKRMIYDNDGDTPDWVEITNTGSISVNLKGVLLSDSANEPARFVFPDFVLNAGKSVIVFASGKTESEIWEFHAPFNISKDGEKLYLASPSGAELDTVKIPVLAENAVYGRQAGSAEWAVLAMPTPGKPNNIYPLEYTEQLKIPSASHQSGFYNGGFSLTLSAEDRNADIYYTIDCSLPDLKSNKYSGPIKINDELKLYNPSLSERQDCITVVGDKMPIPAVIDKAIVIRYRSMKKGYPPSDVKTLVFWTGMDKYKNAPVVSIVTDYENLTDWRSGLLVSGVVHDEWLETNSFYSIQGNRPANYNQRGAAWETDCDFLFVENTYDAIAQMQGRLKMHGGWSRDFPQKSMVVKFYQRGDDDAGLDFPLFPGLKANDDSGRDVTFFRRIILRNSGNDFYNTFFRDAFMNELLRDSQLDIAAYRPAHIFLNGEYWGILNIREYFDEGYFNQHYQMPLKDAVTVLETSPEGFLKFGREETAQEYVDFLEGLKNIKSAGDEDINYINSMVNIDNYLEYMISNIYFGNSDWPGNNIRFWRLEADTFNQSSPYLAFRQLVFDTDFGFGIYNQNNGFNDNTIRLVLQKNGPEWPNPEWSTRLFRTIVSNDATLKKFLTRYCDMTNTYFSESEVKELLEKFSSEYSELIGFQQQRWPWSAAGSEGGWQYNVDVMRTFAEKRLKSLDSFVKNAFSLKDPCSLNIKSNVIPYYLNGIPVDEKDFKGRYFGGSGIKISSPDGTVMKFKDTTTGREFSTAGMKYVINRNISIIINHEDDTNKAHE